MSKTGSEEPSFIVASLLDSDIEPDSPSGNQPASKSRNVRDMGKEKTSSAEIIHIATRHAPSLAKTQSVPISQLPVTFNQAELRLIFGLYGHKVAAGEWRDYALDFLRDRAVFSIFRRSSEVPLYRIEKMPRLARKQGEYAAVAASGLILKRGNDLARILAVLDKPLKIVR